MNSTINTSMLFYNIKEKSLLVNGKNCKKKKIVLLPHTYIALTAGRAICSQVATLFVQTRFIIRSSMSSPGQLCQM